MVFEAFVKLNAKNLDLTRLCRIPVGTVGDAAMGVLPVMLITTVMWLTSARTVVVNAAGVGLYYGSRSGRSPPAATCAARCWQAADAGASPLLAGAVDERCIADGNERMRFLHHSLLAGRWRLREPLAPTAASRGSRPTRPQATMHPASLPEDMEREFAWAWAAAGLARAAPWRGSRGTRTRS